MLETQVLFRAVLANEAHGDRTVDSSVRPVVTVVITTRDRSAFVSEAIESVLRLDQSTFRLDVVVVDDGSVDDTPSVLERYPVRVVRTAGLGIPGARNMGLHSAAGEYLAFLDDDDQFTPAAISAQLVKFAENPDYGCVLGRAQRTDESLVPFGEPFPAADATSGWMLDELLSYQPQIGTVLSRRDVAAQLGGFNTRYAGDDEWDFHLRIARGWQVGRVPETVMLFRQRSGAEEEQQWRRASGVREIYRTNTEHLGLRRRWRLLPVWWKIRGWNCYMFSSYTVDNWRHGRYRRALKSTYYAIRWSPLHTPINLYRLFRTEAP